jgi:8-oxo-dGTP diphosphatase
LLDEEDEVERFASTPVAANGERLGYVPGEPSGDEMVEIHRANREAKISTAEATLSGLVDSVVGGFDAAEALLDAGLSREEAQSQISEEAVSRALIALQDAQESRTVYISTGPEGLAGIVDDGRYKSQFETGTSAGWYDPDLRARYEEEGLGVPFSLDDALRPVYGFVIDSSDTDPSVSNAANYGGAIIEIGRERVADRSTVTLDDSLNMGATGVPMNRPKDEVSREDALASLGGSDLWADFVISAAVSFFEDLEEDDIADELRGRYLDQEDRPYQEVQIHGGVGRDDIDRILVADFDFFEEGTLDKLVESGIKVTDRNGDSWSPSEAVPDNNTPKVPVITLADLPPTSELGESGDGMLTLPNGRRLWGRFGAAGLLVRHTDSDGNVRYFMQKRGEDVQLAGTWSVPGGAIYELETADDGAVREFVEEAGSLPVGRVVGRHVAEQGDGAWAYTTVIYEVDEQFEPDENWESAGGRWLTADEVAELDLHPGFASAWPVLRDGGDDAGSESPESDGVGEVRSYSPAPNRMNPLEPGNTDELVREVDNERGDHEPKAGSIDKALDLIVVKQGFDGLPGLVDSVDDLPEGQPVFYRGVTDTSDESAEDLVDQFAHGDFFVGTGMFGNGIYGSTEEEMALSYATGNSMVANPDGVITFALRPDAKVADWDELVEARKLVDSNSDVAKDPGRVAAILGYDAVIKPVVSATGETQEQILILLNRSAAVVVDPRKKPANNKTAKTRLAGAGAVLNYITENADALSEETPGTPGDWMLNNIYSQQGFDQILPSVVETPDDLPEGTRLFRGIGASKSAFRESVTPDLYDEAVEKVDQFRNGTHYPGTGIIGSGSYFSVDRDDAEDYMHPEDRPWGTTPKTLIFGSLSPDARIADWDDIATVIPILKNELEARRLQVRGDKERARIDFLARLINDPGRVAALMGYDGMQEPTLYRDDDSPIPTRHVVLFNRGVLTVSKVGAPRAPSTRPGVALLRARGLDPDPF